MVFGAPKSVRAVYETDRNRQQFGVKFMACAMVADGHLAQGSRLATSDEVLAFDALPIYRGRATSPGPSRADQPPLDLYRIPEAPGTKLLSIRNRVYDRQLKRFTYCKLSRWKFFKLNKLHLKAINIRKHGFGFNCISI